MIPELVWVANECGEFFFALKSDLTNSFFYCQDKDHAKYWCVICQDGTVQ